MTDEVVLHDVICEEYAIAHECVTLEEIRWILKRLGRHTAYYTYFLIRASTGIRGSEALRLTLHNFSPDLKWMQYRVDKPKNQFTPKGERLVRVKHRRVRLDDWVRSELKAYLDKNCRVVKNIYVTPYENDRLFPWDNLRVVLAYWSKFRKKMSHQGFNSLRRVRDWFRVHRTDPIYVLRPHIFRHFAASIMYYKMNKDIKMVQEWLCHSKLETTQSYIHSSNHLGSDEEYLVDASWAAIFGFDEEQADLSASEAPKQTNLMMY